MTDKMVAVLNMLGLARRSGALKIGQDKVLERSNGMSAFFITSDCSPAVMRKIEQRVCSDGCVCYELTGATRSTLGNAVGVNSTQIVSLPRDSGFVKKIAALLEQGARG